MTTRTTCTWDDLDQAAAALPHSIYATEADRALHEEVNRYLANAEDSSQPGMQMEQLEFLLGGEPPRPTAAEWFRKQGVFW